MEILLVMILLGWLFSKEERREDLNRYDVLYGGEG